MDERILIFGGTFDPPHRAHVELPARVAEHIGATLLLYVPAARNPLKLGVDQASDDHRRTMLEIAVAGRSNVAVSTVELDRGGPSYFVDTLEAIEAAHPGATLQFIIGTDHALDFHAWRDWERILEHAEPVVLRRAPWDRRSLRAALEERYGATEAAWWLARVVDVPVDEVSATEVRDRIAAGEPFDNLVPAGVAAYIREHGLYADGARP